jgi:nucleotide-binding universal stress UspA family protein
MKIASILIPIDFSPDSFYALEYALDLAAIYNSVLHILNVNQDESMLYHYLSTKEYESIRRQALDDALAELHKLEQTYPVLDKIEHHFHVRRGVPYLEILEELEKTPVELVVIASHGRTGARKFYYGATAERVVRRARTTILVTRRPEPGR